ncbi:uncharacterized protein [Aristolochia californica]|uniref:uncharacterized protein n=1 Tax=Aristolochia californica TaxID=171875 RepID=UPI0035E2851E
MEVSPAPSSPPPSEPPPKKIKMSSTSTTGPDSEDEAPKTSQTKSRYKRRKVAIFLAYCGVGYQGMQKNPGAKTIEGDLEEALFLAGAVPEADRGNPKRFDWARSARTDKGVSAVGQVVSGRFYIDPPGLVERLNSHLQPQIRVFGYKRVTNSFNAKKFCDRRRYVYLLPVFALDPTSHPNRESVLASAGSENELAKCVECSERGRKVEGVMGRRNSEAKVLGEDNGNLAPDKEGKIESVPRLSPAPGEIDSKETSNGEKSVAKAIGLESETAKLENKGDDNGSLPDFDLKPSVDEKTQPGLPKRGDGDFHCEPNSLEDETTPAASPEINGQRTPFWYGEEEKERFNRILGHYVGTHNFHNFTTRTKAEDPAARRYIVSFSASSVVSIQGMDFICCEVVGQSFMLHQIRKMIGLAVAVMRNCAPESLFETALKKEVNINVPTAPEVGLYLDECLFSSYNKKWKDTHDEISMEAYAEAAVNFKMENVFSHIASTELKEGVVGLWLHSLNHRNYPDLRGVEINGLSDEKCTQKNRSNMEGLS